MKRLYQKIYLTIVVALLLVVLVAGAIWRFGQPPAPVAEGFEVAGELLAATLPPATAPATTQQEAIRQLAQRLHINVALFDPELRLIGSYGDPPPPPGARGQDRGQADPNAPPRKNNGITGDARKSTAALGKMAFDIKIDYAVKQIQGFLANQTKTTAQQ